MAAIIVLTIRKNWNRMDRMQPTRRGSPRLHRRPSPGNA
jgi:hypothetical protein